MAKTDAVWTELDVDALPADVKAAYEAYKDMYRQMKAQREAFESLCGANVPDGKRMVFGYNFGKLSAAIVDDDRKPAKAKPAKQSLADFIAAQKASGRSV
jgi:hypothetical protein